MCDIQILYVTHLLCDIQILYVTHLLCDYCAKLVCHTANVWHSKVTFYVTFKVTFYVTFALLYKTCMVTFMSPLHFYVANTYVTSYFQCYMLLSCKSPFHVFHGHVTIPCVSWSRHLSICNTFMSPIHT